MTPKYNLYLNKNTRALYFYISRKGVYAIAIYSGQTINMQKTPFLKKNHINIISIKGLPLLTNGKDACSLMTQ